MIKRTLWIFIVVVFGGLAASCSPNIRDNNESPLETGQKDQNQILENNGRIEYEKTIGLNEEVEVVYRLRDYKKALKNYQNFTDLEKTLIPLSGKASFKVKSFGTQEKIGDFVAKEGKIYFYTLFEFKGRSDTPKSNTIHPGSVDETGWDPAPQMVIVIGDKEYYQDSYGNELLRDKGLKAEKAELNQNEWTTQAATWYQNKTEKPILAIKYFDSKGKEKYIKVNY